MYYTKIIYAVGTAIIPREPYAVGRIIPREPGYLDDGAVGQTCSVLFFFCYFHVIFSTQNVL